MTLLIKNVKAIDPRHKLSDGVDVFVRDGKIAKVGKQLDVKADETLDGKGQTLVPGFIDLHVHFREPGGGHKETVATGARAALKGGFVGAVSMPNTQPAADNAAIVEFILKRAREAEFNIFPCGALSKGREGKEISAMLELKNAGCVAVSDDGNYLRNPLVARRAFEYASQVGLIVMSHVEIPELTKGGVMNEGYVSTVMGLKGMPAVSEVIAVATDIELAKMTEARLHISHLSSGAALEKIKRARSEGLQITCEVTPHHLALTENALKTYDTNFKMNPPLRTEEDRQAMLQGVLDGSIDVIATDHAPHQFEEKDQEFELAPFGVIGLETAFAVSYTELSQKAGPAALEILIDRMAITPANILGLGQFNEIAEGSAANFTLLDLNAKWTISKEDFASKSKNSCFLGREVRGRVVATVCNGKLYRWNTHPVASGAVTVQSGCHSGEGRNLSAKGGLAFGGKTSKQDASLRWHDTHPERLPGATPL
ncbi:MAG: dihydroorotase [Candidatus Omnitrophica bacterium]|nr:dihydroorotase [Candidatus Omnitrophota bacterium]